MSTVYNRIVEFLKNARFVEYHENYWGFLLEKEGSSAVIVTTDPKTMYREFHLNTLHKGWFGRQKIKTDIVRKTEVHAVDWQYLDDVLYAAHKKVKKL